MNLPFLRYFKKDKVSKDEVAVAPRPVTPLDKPASERFGKTVMPNVSRIVGVEPTRSFEAAAPAGNPAPVGPSSAPRKISLGGNGAIAVTPKPLAERTIALQLADLVPYLPAGLLQTTPIDPEQRILFKASELERGMAGGRPTALLRSIFQQAPDFFLGDVEATDTREVVLPFGKVLEQFAAFQVRPDQVAGESVPQVETPFLKMTIEDGERFGKSATLVPAPTPLISSSIEAESAPLPAPVSPASVKLEKTSPAPPSPSPAAPAPLEQTPAMLPETAVVSPPPIRPIRLSVPNESRISAGEAPPPAPIRLEPASAAPPLAAKKISPNGMGVSAAERVPASGGPPVPTPLPSPFAPVRIPFKVSPPSNDLREASLPAMPAPPPKAAVAAFSSTGPRLRLPLRNVLRGISPFQLSGPIDDVSETAVIEIPFSIIEPQLSLGRIAVSPAQFQAALPEEYRSLLKIEETEQPVVLPLQEVLQNLPNESLQLRGDQEEIEITEVFETPFSTKAAEDAARLKVSTEPIAKAGGVEAAVSAATAKAAVPTAAPAPSVPAFESDLPLQPTRPPLHQTPPTIPATAPARTALQIAFDTDETLDAKSIVVHASRLAGVSACAIVFSDGLSLAGNIPAEYEAEALCALAPSILKRIDDQMIEANLGRLNGITLYCAKTPVSFFAHGNICLAALHSAGELAAEIRARLSSAVREIARMYAQPA
jgi:predicted regulator of Ras-like GTPase activity (Roadblock/LC7/MglB family)